MTYLVVLNEDSKSLTVEAVVESAKGRWPASEPLVDPAALDTSRVIEWQLVSASGQGVEVAVNEALTSFAVDGPLEGSAEVIAWVRTVVEPEVDLTVCDDGYNFDFALLPGATHAWVTQQLEDLAE